MAMGQNYRERGGVLQEPTRKRIYEAVGERGRATYTELLRALKLRNGTLQYHLSVLVREGLLMKEEGTGSRRPFRVSGRYLNLDEQAS